MVVPAPAPEDTTTTIAADGYLEFDTIESPVEETPPSKPTLNINSTVPVWVILMALKLNH